MRPSVTVPLLAKIEFHTTDEDLVEHLVKMDCGAPLPDNVLSDVNPYIYLPWDLPDYFWFFSNSVNMEATDTGYWKAAGEQRRIPKNATTTCCRTILEFYNGRAPYGTKTGWMMYEYKLYRKGLSELNEAQNSSSLCRVFLNNVQSPNHEDHQSHTRAHDANGGYIRPLSATRGNNYGSNRSQMNYGINENGLLSVFERQLRDQRPNNPIQDLHENYDFARGDFLALDDLVNPESPSSSESSCLTMSSEEYFDSQALLSEIEAENTQKTHTDSTLCVSTSHRPKQMLLKPTSGSAVQQHVPKSKVQEHVAVQGPQLVIERKIKKQVVGQDPHKKLRNEVASSTGLPANSGGKGKAEGLMTKLRKKLCCFMPF